MLRLPKNYSNKLRTMYFDKELEFLNNYEITDNETNKRQKISEYEVNTIRNNYPNLPLDYTNYLFEIGSGNLCESSFKIYSGLCDFDDLGLEDIYQIPENIKFFGDNYSGDFAGFDISDSTDEVIEFWHDSDRFFKTGKTFRQYVRDKMGID